jgi:hypothetical protein
MSFHDTTLRRLSPSFQHDYLLSMDYSCFWKQMVVLSTAFNFKLVGLESRAKHPNLVDFWSNAKETWTTNKCMRIRFWKLSLFLRAVIVFSPTDGTKSHAKMIIIASIAWYTIPSDLLPIALIWRGRYTFQGIGKREKLDLVAWKRNSNWRKNRSTSFRTDYRSTASPL